MLGLLMEFLIPSSHGCASLPEDVCNCLITGSCRSHLFTLASTFALNQVSASPPHAPPTQPQQGGAAASTHNASEVVILSKRGALDGCPLVLPQGMLATQPGFSRVKLRHLKSCTELQQFASCLHLLPTPPAAIIVVGISDFFTRAGMQEDWRASETMLAKTLAFLVSGADTIRSMTQKKCPLIVTDELPAPTSFLSSDDPRSKVKSLFILQRWLPLVLEVSETKGQHGTLYMLGLHPLSAAAFSKDLPGDMRRMKVSYKLSNSLEVTSVS